MCSSYVHADEESKAYCAANFLSRGRTNHNIGVRVTYLTCQHEGCNVKLRIIKKLDLENSILEHVEAFDHENDMEIPHERGLTVEQKRIVIECYDRDYIH